MKKVYRAILRFFENTPIRFERFKTRMFELIAISRKKKLYKNVKWTKEQTKEFNEYWKKHYGKKISNRWHKLYEASNGVHNVEYFPEILYSTKLEYKLNSYKYTATLANKSFNAVLFDNRIPNVRAPYTFVFKNNGQYFDADRNPISKETAINLISNIGPSVIKPTVDSSSGKDVNVIDLRAGQNVKNGKSIDEIFNSYGDNFIVQEKIKQHSKLSALYPNSTNTIRMITYFCDNDIFITPISLRIGGSGSEVDNIHAGGISISVSNEGYLSKYAYRLGCGDLFEKFEVHPDTNVRFENYKLDFIEDMIRSAKKLHTLMSNLGIISWDFTVDEDGNIVVVEANLKGQSVWFPQMLSGRALFGDNMPQMLSLIRKRKK